MMNNKKDWIQKSHDDIGHGFAVRTSIEINQF